MIVTEKATAVSVIIPTCNRAHLLGCAAQSFRGHEAEVYIEPVPIMFKQKQGAGRRGNLIKLRCKRGKMHCLMIALN